MHASDYAGEDPRGWIVQEKFDGFFARWTGTQLLTREGHDFNLPLWFTQGLPAFALDCELYAGPGKRDMLQNIWNARGNQNERWLTATLIVFDKPFCADGYQQRYERISAALPRMVPHIQIARFRIGTSVDAMWDSLHTVHIEGGEGLIIRHPDAPYITGRVKKMLKVKAYHP